jgi:hypothetical protein
MLRVVLFLSLMGWCDALTAGAHKDYEGSAECEQSLEGINSTHFLDDTIYYEAATGVADEVQKSPRTIETVPAKLPNKLTFTPGTDPRVEQVRQFFTKYKSPAAKYAELFIQVADANDLDWNLLPMFAFVETGGGIYKHNNNIFGWDSGKKKFHSVEEGIRYVGQALQTGPYKNKSTLAKIKIYNQRMAYIPVALRVMNQIAYTSLKTR